MKQPRIIGVLVISMFLWAVGTAAGVVGVADDQPSKTTQPSTRELHRGHKHPAGVDPTRFFTNREGAPLPLPGEEDAFFFAIFGDRTGGRPEGVRILEDAVRDVNLLEPDLVMTVGDLVEGYNATDQWLKQMREFKGVMADLLCPWFPVAGNHDIYWRGPNRPRGQHERNYEMHFGPLWYAFEHKNCWFIVLHSEEGNPKTGEKSFEKPDAQRMSDDQFAWLTKTLTRTVDAQHVFVFLHHPRWLKGKYGDDWDKVHKLLAENGKVRAVFAGHIHRMRYDGVQDGIEYVTLATTGGAQGGAAPEAGYLHHYHLVTVRANQIAMAAVPVGEVMDVRSVTGTVSEEAHVLTRLTPRINQPVQLHEDGSVAHHMQVTIANPVSRPIEVSLTPDSDDSRWRIRPDHMHRVIAPGETFEFAFDLSRHGDGIDESIRTPQLIQQIDYLAESQRFSIPARHIDLPLTPQLAAPTLTTIEHALAVDGNGDLLGVPHELVDLPDGPLTLECWFNARSFASRTGLITKTEGSEYGFFLNDGLPTFAILLGRNYVDVRNETVTLEPGRWYHIAGVFDGAEARLYLDGDLIASVKRAAPRRTNRLPLLIGADVDRNGRGTSYFDGWIDAVHLSTVARYQGERFEPKRRPAADEHTRLLLNMDGLVGPWAYDESGRAAHPTKRGDARIVPVK